MATVYQIPVPFIFNPLKHHMGFITEFITLISEDESNSNIQDLTKRLKHLGKSVMDVYTGSLSVNDICKEAEEFLEQKNLTGRKNFFRWVGNNLINFKTIILSDGSQWTLKFHDNKLRFVHIFPARNSPLTIRAKGNTLKSAILYNLLIAKNFISGDDLNKVRAILHLSPIKSSVNTESITKMIEILRVKSFLLLVLLSYNLHELPPPPYFLPPTSVF